MTTTNDPTRPTQDKEKFKPQNVAEGGAESGRADRTMKNLPRGSECDIRRKSGNRND